MVYSRAFFEHLTAIQQLKILKEVYRVLKINGICIVTTPYKEDLNELTFKCINCGQKQHKLGHIESIDEKLLIKFKMAEFKRVKQIHAVQYSGLSYLPWFITVILTHVIEKTNFAISKPYYYQCTAGYK